MIEDVNGRTYRAQRWAARTALAAAGLAVLVPLGYGGLGGVLLLVGGAVGLAVTAAAVWWTLSLRGPLRWAAALVALVVPACAVALFATTLLWALPLSLALWGLAVWCGRYALRGTGSYRVKERRCPPPERPFLIMNPRSGGGGIVRYGPPERAKRLGACERESTLNAPQALLVSNNRSCGLNKCDPTQPHAPNGLERTGRQRTQPRGSDTDPVRGPIPGGRFPHDLAIWVRPEATGRPRTITPVERGPRTLAPYPASQIAQPP